MHKVAPDWTSFSEVTKPLYFFVSIDSIQNVTPMMTIYNEPEDHTNLSQTVNYYIMMGWARICFAQVRKVHDLSTG